MYVDEDNTKNYYFYMINDKKDTFKLNKGEG